MKIALTDGYHITVDNYNYILKQDYVVRKGKHCGNITTRTVGYYSNGIKGLKGCIKRYLEECSLDAEKSAQIDFENFCDHLEQTVITSTEWIMAHISDCVMALKDAEQEIERLKKELSKKESSCLYHLEKVIDC